MKIYDLMHNNEIVAIVQMNDIGKLEKAVIKTPELVPPQGKLSIQDLQKWWERRAVPITQGNIKFLLRQLNIDSPVRIFVSKPWTFFVGTTGIYAYGDGEYEVCEVGISSL